MFVAVIMAAAHLADLRELLRVVGELDMLWLALALLLQLATYASQGAIWRTVGRAASIRISRCFAFELTVAELFVDQALPSGGASGTAFVARVLRDRGHPADVVAAGAVARTAAYGAGYAVMLCVALALRWPGSASFAGPVHVVTAAFCVLSGTTVLLPWLTGRALGKRFKRLAKLWGVRRALAFVDVAAPALARSPRVLLLASLLQAATILLDAATMWVLVRALGAQINPAGVFSSFMLASVFRSIGIAPGGLGTFEATSMLTLHAAGAPLEVAVAATLLFRGLSFWLPMAPGLWLSRRVASPPA